MKNRFGIMRKERGNALVLSVLILLALTSVGLVSVQRTNTDLGVAGNLVRARQAQIAGEAGTGHAVHLVAATINQVIVAMEQRNATSGSVDRTWHVCSLSTVIPDCTPGGAGEGNHIPILEPNTGPDTAARLRQDLAYDVNGHEVGEIQGMPGYEVDSDICNFIWDFNTRGGIPTSADQEVEDTLSQQDTVVVRSRARAIAGPWQCSYSSR